MSKIKSKASIVKKFCKKRGVKTIDLKTSMVDTSHIAGFPTFFDKGQILFFNEFSSSIADCIEANQDETIAIR